MFGILATAMYDDDLMEEMDRFYNDLTLADVMTAKEYYGDDLEEALDQMHTAIGSNEKYNQITGDTLMGFGINYKQESCVEGTLAYLKEAGVKGNYKEYGL